MTGRLSGLLMFYMKKRQKQRKPIKTNEDQQKPTKNHLQKAMGKNKEA